MYSLRSLVCVSLLVGGATFGCDTPFVVEPDPPTQEELDEETRRAAEQERSAAHDSLVANLGAQRSFRVAYEKSMKTYVLFSPYSVSYVTKGFNGMACNVLVAGSVTEVSRDDVGVVVRYHGSVNNDDRECNSNHEVFMTKEMFLRMVINYREQLQELEPSATSAAKAENADSPVHVVEDTQDEALPVGEVE